MIKLLNKVVFIANKKTSMRLASVEWEAIEVICQNENIKRNDLIEEINRYKDPGLGLTCSVRLFTIIYFHQLLIEIQKNPRTKTNPFKSPIYAAIDGII